MTEELRQRARELREDIQREAEKIGAFMVIEDGYTFLSAEELTEYRQLKIVMAYEEGTG